MYGSDDKVVQDVTDELRCSIELREDASRSSPGRLVGVLLAYDERAADRPEVFEAGALSWPSNGVLVRRQHQRGAPIMRVLPETRGGQVVIDQPLPDTVAGRDAASEIRSGLFAGLSIEFRSTREHYVGGVRHIAGALLTGAGLVDTPSYRGSRVELRERQGRRRLWL